MNRYLVAFITVLLFSGQTLAGQKNYHRDSRGLNLESHTSEVWRGQPVFAYSGKKWDELTPKEQEKLRRKKEKYEALPDDEQQRIRKARERYEKMPPDKKEQLRKKWDDMTPEEKKRYRLEQNYRY
jgi:hypothetical protein